jgi:hypothetical protein
MIMATKKDKADKASTAAGDKPAGADQAGTPQPGLEQTLEVAPPKAEDSAKPALPAQVTMASLYGFYDDEGSFHSWAEGHVVTDPAHIELLIARGAPLAE